MIYACVWRAQIQRVVEEARDGEEIFAAVVVAAKEVGPLSARLSLQKMKKSRSSEKAHPYC